MGPYTKLAVRTLGPATGLTLEQHAKVPTYVPNSPSRGTRRQGEGPKPDDGRWWEQGPCARQGHDSVWLSPSKHAKADVYAAAAKCQTCPVKEQCEAQPYPHVGITAGRIHWDGAAAATNVRLCEQCLEPMSRKSRFCSQKCKDRWYYVVRVQEGEQPVGPLMAYFKNRPVTHIARECGVAVRTVYRWDEAGVIPGGAVRQIVNRLHVRIEDIWPDRARQMVVTGDPSEDTTDCTGDASMSNVRHLPTFVKFGPGS